MEKINVESLNQTFDIDGPAYIYSDGSDHTPLNDKEIIPWNKGLKGWFKHTEESKKLITGRPPGFNHSEQWKEQKSESMRGKDNHFYGKKHTEEASLKMSAKSKKWYRFVSPRGEEWVEFTTVREFAKKIGKHHSTIIKGPNWQVIETVAPKVSQ